MKALVLFCLMISSVAFADYAEVNGIKIYYEIHGKSEGTPLVLLHGGGSTIDVTWGKVLPLFAKNRKVIAIEEESHGRSSSRPGPSSFEASADDVAAVLKSLKITQADVFGFSNGASVALHVAIRHPELVSKLIFASSITKKSGAHSWFWDYMKKANFSNMPQPLKDAFLKVNPNPDQLLIMHDKDANRMRTFKDTPDKLIKQVKAKTLIVAGDKELVKPEHVLELNRLIKDSRMLLLPAGHGDYLGEAIMTKPGSKYHESFAGIIEEFLD